VIEAFSTLEVYDPATDHWSTRAPMPTARAYAAGGIIAGQLYVAGGLSASRARLAVLEVYDPSTDRWTTKAPMPTARNAPGAAVIDGKLYVIGGSNASTLELAPEVYDTLELYDPATDTWTTEAPMPTPRYGAGTVALNGRLHVVGGYDAASPVAVHEVFTPEPHGPCGDGSSQEALIDLLRTSRIELVAVLRQSVIAPTSGGGRRVGR
jgi:N-acetylneuraminic acid mutarotase